MESNSPGRSPRDDDRHSARRERSRSRTRMTSRVNFFEFGAAQQARQNSPSPKRRPSDMSTSIVMDIPIQLEDSVFDQSEVDQLEREISERRQRLSRDQDERRPAVALRRVVSPVRVEPVRPPRKQFATEVYISSWSERVSQSPDRASPPTPPPRADVQPPWRLARRSEPAKSSTSAPPPTPTFADDSNPSSPFPVVTTPASALSKYQEWRARRLTSVESPEHQIAPWRRQQQQRRASREGSSSPSDAGSLSPRRPFEPEFLIPPSNVRKASQPQWYTEFQAASFTQTSARMDAFRSGVIKTHYDFHIAEIKGETYDGGLGQ